MIMMDLNKIQSIKTLEEMRDILKEFLTFDRTAMLKAYDEDFGWDAEDYEADREQARPISEHVEKRMKSLGHHLAKVDKNASQSPVPPAVTESASPAA